MLKALIVQIFSSKRSRRRKRALLKGRHEGCDLRNDVAVEVVAGVDVAVFGTVVVGNELQRSMLKMPSC